MLTRRQFLHASGAALLASTRRARAPLRVVVLRESTAGSESMMAGARLGSDEASRAARMFDLPLTVRDAEPWSGGLPRDADVVVGGMTDASCARLSELAESAGVLFLDVGSTDDALRGAACGATTFHVAASEAMHRDARRLAAMGDDARVALWLPTLEAFGAAQLNDRFRQRIGAPMDSAAWAGWFAVKAVSEAYFRARGGDAAAVRAQLVHPDARFDGHKGKPLSFRAWDRQLRQPLYVLGRAGTEPVELPRRGEPGSTWEQLDRLGTRASDSTCHAS